MNLKCKVAPDEKWGPEWLKCRYNRLTFRLLFFQPGRPVLPSSKKLRLTLPWQRPVLHVGRLILELLWRWPTFYTWLGTQQEKGLLSDPELRWPAHDLRWSTRNHPFSEHRPKHRPLTCHVFTDQTARRCQTKAGCGICFLIWRLSRIPFCLKTVCANYFLRVYFSDAPAVVMIRSSGLVKEEFGAGKQCRRKEESLQPQTSTIPANHWRFRKFLDTTKPTGGLGLLMGWLVFLLWGGSTHDDV